MDPKVVLQTVHHEFQQLVQDLLGIDGEKHNLGRRPVSIVEGDQGSDVCFASKGRENEDKGSRSSITSQGYEKCI